ncbi:olfactory receptor 1D2-like [Engraulis encrasicolus]|uniref:olfactory receptor 1D2-like n=1 Tax=Engraulis encrasicolus TaxID=184585 RepID=UPI002FD0471A
MTCILYIVIIFINATIIFTVRVDKALHEPMYIFLANLSINALYGTVGFYPKFLIDLLSDVAKVSYSQCLTQTIIIYSSSICDMTTLTAMAFDRYVAICKPLQYHSILTSRTVFKLLSLAWLYPLSVSIMVIILATREGRRRFTQTCLPHITAILVCILSLLFDLSYSWAATTRLPLALRNALGMQFLILPPICNPLVYGLQLPKMRRAILKAAVLKAYLKQPKVTKNKCIHRRHH